MEKGPDAYRSPGPLRRDPVLQTRAGAGMPDPILNFEGVSNVNSVQPADTTMAVGPDHVFQWVNLAFQVFDKAGNSLAGPLDGNTLFTDLGGDCAAINGGDIIVLYDQFADRWILTQLAPAIFGATGNHQCIAVSVTGDPLGAYYLYDYLYGDALNDYPKFGKWPDAYYMTAREFGGKGGFTMTVTAFDRTAMLNGQPFTAIFVSLNNGALRRAAPRRSRRSQSSARHDPESGRHRVGRSRADPSRRRPAGRGRSRGRDPHVQDASRLRDAGQFDVHGARRLPDRGLQPGSVLRAGAAARSRGGHRGSRLDPLPAAVPEFRNARVDRPVPRCQGRVRPRPAALVRVPRSVRRADRVPAGNLRAGRRREPMDGLGRPRRQRQHGRRLQRLGRHRDVPRHPLRRPARDGSAERALAGRSRAHRGLRRLPGEPLGRLQHDGHRPGRRLHLLVHDDVHRQPRPLELADAPRVLQVSELLRSRLRHGRGHRHRRRRPDRRRPRRRHRLRRRRRGNHGRLGTLRVRSSGRDLQPHGPQVRLFARDGDGRRNHAGRIDDPRLHVVDGAFGDRERHCDGRLGRRLAPLREARHHDAGRARVHRVHRPGDGQLRDPARHGQRLPVRDHRGGSGLHSGRRIAAARSGGRRRRRRGLGRSRSTRRPATRRDTAEPGSRRASTPASCRRAGCS